MPLAERRSEVAWEGNLAQGHGTVGVITAGQPPIPISWKARTESSTDGSTSPEMLLAGAQAACYAMSLANQLSQGGTPPEWLEITATCTLDRVDGKAKITTMRIEAQGKVHGVDQAGFEAAARTAEQNCPVSNALRGNVTIELAKVMIEP
jgi:osmotically inducible protein OsmC